MLSIKYRYFYFAFDNKELYIVYKEYLSSQRFILWSSELWYQVQVSRMNAIFSSENLGTSYQTLRYHNVYV